MAARLAPTLEQHTNVRRSSSVDEALAALRDGGVDLVLCSDSELLPLARASSRERAGSILEGIAQGGCIVGRDGKLIWANAAMRAYPPDVVEAIRAVCAELVAELAGVHAPPDFPRVRQRALTVGPERHFDLSVSAVPNVDGEIDEAVGLFTDTTEVSRMREKLDAIDAAGRELVALDVGETAQLDVGERLQLLERKLIRYCRDLLHFTHFAVLVLDPKTKHLDTVLAGGFSQESMNIDIYAREEGNGISGYVAATGQSYLCPDISNDPRYLPGFECASSSLTVPLRLVDRVVGVLNVESDQPGAFSEEDRQVAEIFAHHIAVALHTLKLLAVERSETTGQLTAELSTELAAPLDNILGSVSRLIDDPPSPDDLRERLRSVITQVDRVKASLQTLSQAPAIRGLSPEASCIDPALKAKRVLVADDENIIRETIADLLNKAGAIPVMASDGEEAIAMINTQPFDLVLSDIKMPNRNGYEVFAATKRANAACPVILITGFGYDPDHVIVRASHEGLAAVLFKPFKVEQLLEAVHKAVAPAEQ